MIKIREATKKGYAEAHEGDSVNYAYPNSDRRRGRVGKQIANTITTQPTIGVVVKTRGGYEMIRKLTPRECWRVMGFSDEDFDKAAEFTSNAQLYKQAGNSIVKQVLMAIFKELY